MLAHFAINGPGVCTLTFGGVLSGTGCTTPFLQSNIPITELLGATGDGTWQIVCGDFNVVSGLCGFPTQATKRITLSVGGKSIEYITRGSGGATDPNSICGNGVQLWNWRTTTTTFVDNQCPDTTIQADEDPNNAVFFQDTDASNPDAFTSHSTVSCPSSVTLNGVWSRGSLQTLNTFATFYHVQGLAGDDQDLRNNIGVLSTGYVDKGSGTQGTHSAVIGYNNVAGNSYQLVAKNGTGGSEQLGAVLFVSPMQCGSIPAPPSASTNDHEFQIEASQAQCNGDQTTFVITMDDGPPDQMNVTFFNTQTGSIVMIVETSQMRNFNSHTYYFNRTFVPGNWLAYAFQNAPGITAPDRFDAAAFSVPLGTCIDTPFDDSVLRAEHATLMSEHETQGLYAHCQNTTTQVGDCQGIRTNLTEVHDHIDQHFNDINATCISCEFNLTDFEDILNMTLNQTFAIQSQPIADSITVFGEFVIWVLLVAVAFLCAASNRLPLVIAAIPIGLFSIAYGVSKFDSQLFDIAAIAAGAMIAATIFAWRNEQQQKEQKNNGPG